MFKMWIAKGIIFGMYLLMIAAVDMRKRKIKLWLLFGGIALAIVLRLLTDGVEIMKEGDLWLGVICGIFFLAVSWITRERFGYADSMAILALLIHTGFDTGLVCVTGAFVYAAAASLFLMAVKKANRETALPFLPYLFAGYVTGVILTR
jgi:leader peptidase (prepilin peptidase)/N-methyltransferase